MTKFLKLYMRKKNYYNNSFSRQAQSHKIFIIHEILSRITYFCFCESLLSLSRIFADSASKMVIIPTLDNGFETI